MLKMYFLLFLLKLKASKTFTLAYGFVYKLFNLVEALLTDKSVNIGQISSEIDCP